VIPKEHGAYGQLLFPLLTALAIGRPGVASFALAGSTICTFLAHEPLLVLLGQRGARAGRELRRTAFVWFAVCATFAVMLAAIAILAAPPSRRAALGPSVVLAGLLALFIAAGRERSVAGETLSALAFASIAYPIGAWSSASMRASLSCAAAFAAVFASAIVSVHAVIAFTRKPPATAQRAGAVVAAIVAASMVYLLASWRVLEIVAPIAIAPSVLASTALAIIPPSARNLRVVGWTLVTTGVLTAGILLAAFR